MITTNYLSNAGFFGGTTNADISGKYPTLITPAGYAFSIWGLIFLGLLAFAVYQALPSQQANPRFRAVGWWVVLNAICNAIWSPLFNNERIDLALVVILAMLFSLAIIEQRLLARTNTSLISANQDASLPEMRVIPAETWLARIPFSIYFGWLTVATILNVAVYLKASGFNMMGISEETWAISVLVVGLTVGAILFNRYRSVAYILVFTWAYVAIALKQVDHGDIKIIAGVGAMLAVILAVVGLLSNKTPSYT
ncbi:hypothetical protein GCM10028807_59260 [Spirosoma daeguense]